jgi:hypothetical protein
VKLINLCLTPHPLNSFLLIHSPTDRSQCNKKKRTTFLLKPLSKRKRSNKPRGDTGVCLSEVGSGVSVHVFDLISLMMLVLVLRIPVGEIRALGIHP